MRTKTIPDEDGEQVGVVSKVRQGTAYVEPNSDLTDELKGTLGMDNTDKSAYALPNDQIETSLDTKFACVEIDNC